MYVIVIFGSRSLFYSEDGESGEWKWKASSSSALWGRLPVRVARSLSLLLRTIITSEL